MRKAFLILTGLVVVGCTTAPVANPPEPLTVIKPVQEIIEPEQKTNIYYYDVDQNRPAQPAAVVSGKFEWKDGCLYLVDNNGEYMTPLFPKYPKGLVKWDESTKIINLDGHIFNMGDPIYTNGGYQDYVPNSVGDAEYEKQGNTNCLAPTQVKVGTMSLGNK